MFIPEGLSKTIFTERYAINAEETWEDACMRISSTIASIEEPEKIKEIRQKFFEEISSNRFCPAGRIWYGSSRPKGQLLNCFVVPTMDSREGWGDTVRDSIIVSGTGGGVGFNFSPVRPRGSEIRGHSGKATGATSLMEIVNAAGEVIRAGGGRRTALMLCLNHDHPDVPEFMDKKLDLKQLNNANVSVVFMNESIDKFLKKVERDELHEFMWNENVVSTIPARDLWNKILDNSVTSGEPGILNGCLANEQNNIWYYRQLESTNPCGEIWLEKYGCCDLGALVLPRFIKDGQLDRKLLARTIQIAVRFLDNVLDVNTYPLKAIEDNCKEVRRIGLGVMGLHDMLILLGKKYTSDEGRDYINSLFSFIKKKAYEASIYLAVEKGQFPALNRHKFVESGFCKDSLSEGMLERILEYGIRNCAVLTIAPTGTTSLLSGVTSGIEPIYAFAYKRRFRSGESLQEETMQHPLFAELKDKVDNSIFESALDIPVEDHIKMQVICQAHVDNAISKTINVPKNYVGKDLDKVVRKYVGKMKGITLYRDGSRGESPIEPLSLEEAAQLNCKSGVCDI